MAQHPELRASSEESQLENWKAITIGLGHFLTCHATHSERRLMQSHLGKEQMDSYGAIQKLSCNDFSIALDRPNEAKSLIGLISQEILWYISYWVTGCVSETC